MKAVFLDRSTIDPSISLEAIKAQVSELVEYDLTSANETFERVRVFIAPKITIWKPSRKAIARNMLKTFLMYIL